MNGFTCVAMALLVSTPAFGLNMKVTVSSDLTFDAEGAKNRPVTKVITLLKDMLKQMEKEADEEQDIYDRMACWCVTNDKSKSKSIADAKSRIESLTSSIESHTATSAGLTTEVANLNTEKAADQSALDKATAIRQKSLAEFNSEEKDSLGSIASLADGLTVMKKHNSLLQISSSSNAEAVAASVQNVMETHSSMLESVMTRSQRSKLAAFLQAPSYAPASGEIFGILGQMKETFETNLASSQKEEGDSQKGFEDLKAAKEAEIAAGEDQIDSKTLLLASTDEKNAKAKQDKEDTQTSLSADEDFLSNLKEKCQQNDSEWEERQKTRQLEMEACSKALAVLSSDDSHDLFTKTFNFVQKESAVSSQRRVQASELLSSIAGKVDNPRLATLAVRVRLDAFTRVKASIDSMVSELVKEKQDEIKQKDFCVDEFNKNELSTEKKTRDRNDATSTIEDLVASIAALTNSINVLKGEIADMQKQLKRAGEDREKENKEFQMTVADQRATQKLLTAALNILKGFYAKKAASALVQAGKSAGPAPPPGFDSYSNNAASGGVMGLIGQIINDAKAMEAEVIRSESDAQKAYESNVKSTNASIAAKNANIVNKSEDKAKKDGERVTAKGSKASIMLELEQLGNTKAELHASCDFVVKNFDVRQTARDEEIEALKQAKAILSGSKFSAFLQNLN